MLHSYSGPGGDPRDAVAGVTEMSGSESAAVGHVGDPLGLDRDDPLGLDRDDYDALALRNFAVPKRLRFCVHSAGAESWPTSDP
jgi:hypothetical protein